MPDERDEELRERLAAQLTRCVCEAVHGAHAAVRLDMEEIREYTCLVVAGKEDVQLGQRRQVRVQLGDGDAQHVEQLLAHGLSARVQAAVHGRQEHVAHQGEGIHAHGRFDKVLEQRSGIRTEHELVGVHHEKKGLVQESMPFAGVDGWARSEDGVPCLETRIHIRLMQLVVRIELCDPCRDALQTMVNVGELRQRQGVLRACRRRLELSSEARKESVQHVDVRAGMPGARQEESHRAQEFRLDAFLHGACTVLHERHEQMKYGGCLVGPRHVRRQV